MAMAAMEAMPFGGTAGGRKRPLVTSGRTSGGGLGFVRMRIRAVVDERVLSSSAALGAWTERIKVFVSLATNDDGARTRNWSVRGRETRRNCATDEGVGAHVLERQYCEADNAVYAPNSQGGEHAGSSLSKEYGAGEEGSLASTFREETRRSGRRAFSTSCLFAILAFPSIGVIGEALAEDTLAKPPKKKGRAPSSPYDEDRLLEQNRRMQRLNNAPTEFPGFVREGFQVKVITGEKYVTSKSGLIYYDMVVGNGDLPQDGQQVIFHYTGYNESGRRVDSSYQQGRPARTRVGIQGMIPGFEEGIKTMRPGGRRIIIVPPELGPPVGPSTFFSAKQFEVFDVELLEAKDCSRRTLLFYSDVVCD